MTLAIIFVIAAIIALAVILGIAVTRNRQISRSNASAGQISPIDVEAFRNLVDPAEDAYLRKRLSPSDFRRVHRERLRATAAYVKESGRNAALLVRIGQAALSTGDARTLAAAQKLVDDALLLRRNAAFVLLRINIALALPNLGLAATPVVDSYERLSSSAMLFGRLQSPATPVRISASR